MQYLHVMLNTISYTISHTISHSAISHGISHWYRMRYRIRYRIMRYLYLSHAISYAILQCDIACDISECDIACDIALDIACNAISHAIKKISHLSRIQMSVNYAKRQLVRVRAAGRPGRGAAASAVLWASTVAVVDSEFQTVPLLGQSQCLYPVLPGPSRRPGQGNLKIPHGKSESTQRATATSQATWHKMGQNCANATCSKWQQFGGGPAISKSAFKY